MGDDPSVDVPIERLLKLVCAELGMETAFIGRVDAGQRTICYVGGPGLEPGDSDPLDGSYCQLVVDGAVDRVIPDVRAVPQLRDLPITEKLGIGSYLGLPLTLSDGSLYGTLCAFGTAPNPALQGGDERLLKLLAALVMDRLEDDVRRERTRAADTSVITELMATGQPRMVFQPIVDLQAGRAVGFEALSRFTSDPYRPPDQWFGAAAAVGLGPALEVHAIAQALIEAATLPAGCYVTVNASPEVILGRRLVDLLAGADRPIVVEVTEHEESTGHHLGERLTELKTKGHRVALDDLGAGHSGLNRLLALRPDIVKLDREIIRGIHGDIARRSLVAAAVAFASDAGGTLVAEGIETAAEAEAVAALGVRYGQGYFYAKPDVAAVWSERGTFPVEVG